MDWSVVPILTVTVVGFVGVSLMAAAFVMVARQGGWRQAMRSGPDGRWGLPRRLMFAGAFLGIVFGVVVMILFSVPGGVPWNDSAGWSFVAVLPPVVAVWYFVLSPTFASRRHGTAGRASSQENSRSR